MTAESNAPCICGSGKKYANCCLEKKPHPDPSGSGEPDAPDLVQTYDTIAFALRIESIKHLIESFGEKHLTPEYTTYALNLCDKVSLTSDLNIFRGRKAIWAASIVYAVARLNFLFDTQGELVLTPALICTHFDTIKSTVGNRASQIQKTCGIGPGAKGYCRREAADKPKNPAEYFLEYRRGLARKSREANAVKDDKQLKLFEN